MMISTKGRYAVRIMLDIGQYYEGEPVRVKDIAARQDLSVKYSEQIIATLVKAGFLKSVRGPQGGYRLTRKPADYKIGDILRLTEGSLAPVECLDSPENDCPRAEGCVTLRLWTELNEAIQGVLGKYTLEDLISWGEAAAANFVI